MFLTNLSLKRPVFATVIILALVSLGIISYVGLNINDYPEVEFPYVVVTVVQQGASPEQIETKIARKLEEAVGQISGVKHIYTTAQEGVATVVAEFSLETSPEVAAQDVRDKIGTIRGELPDDIEDPVIARFDPTAFPIISLAITGNITQKEMTGVVDDLVKKRLEVIKGVGNITVYGAQEREIQINLDKDKLAAYGITTSEVLASLGSENMEVPGGKVSSNGREITLRTMGQVDRPANFLDLPVARKDGVQIYVKDIATVVDGVKEMDSSSRYQGKPAIGLDVVKQSGSNTVLVADSVKEAVEDLRKELPPGVSLDIVSDNSVYIRDSVRDVFNTIIEGALLAVAMVFIFLRDWRSTMISALSIPTSIIATFFAMKMMNFSLNFMSLMALSLSVGLLIDDAIVVIENIVRHMRMGKTPLAAAKEASEEIGLAVMSTTLTVVAVFLPVAMMTGIVGQFFKQFGITVVFSVLVSLLVSFTLVPLLASRHLKDEKFRSRGPLGKFLAWFNKGFDNFNLIYAHFLRVVLRNRWKTMGVALLLFIGSIMLVPLLGSSFIPSADMGEFTVEAEFDAGLNLEAAAGMTDKLEAIIRDYPEVVKTYSTINTDKVNIYVKMVDKKERERSASQIAADLRKKLHEVPGIRTAIVMQAGLNVEKTVVFRLLGDDMNQLQKYAEQAQGIMESIPGAVDVGSSYIPGKPEGKVQIKQDVAADLGISTAQIGDTLRTLFNGVVVSQYEDGEDRVDVRVRLGDGQRKGLDDLSNIYLTSSIEPAGGGPHARIALSQVTEQSYATSPSKIRRFDRAKEIELSGNLDGISLGEFNKIFDERVKKEMPLPPGYSITASGESERMGDTFTSMGIALVTAILFIFFILASQFESYIDPFAIMFSIPMAIVGAIFGLLVMGSDLSLMSMIGIIMLMGLVTKNAILLIDFTKQRRTQGMERSEAIISAGLTRLRPIIMTSMAMIFGMLPLALALGSGAESRAPMAHAIIGGLIASTMLTLVVVPVMYTFLDDLKNKVYSVTRRSKAPAAEAE
ncbi:acriflavin resistance protein [Desulfocucumis palustris]|uniref:Acriflavin resistance protein n=1 Tax=Desulfocucumis palustris TaxID=1898651 RepID=A0A2L2XFW7_9FIRM|nr:efflux RND transporter permease subunit [Desulfocucumis palustris]GBF35249.1 acriflavin resistance protein [Desulfocucumis palustris]